MAACSLFIFIHGRCEECLRGTPSPVVNVGRMAGVAYFILFVLVHATHPLVNVGQRCCALQSPEYAIRSFITMDIHGRCLLEPKEGSISNISPVYLNTSDKLTLPSSP